MIYSYPYATVTEVIDGDTFWVDIDLGLRLHAHHKVRLRGINAPEMTDHPAGPRSKAWLERYLPVGTPVELLAHAWTYDRLECDAMRKNGLSIAAAVVTAGQAVKRAR